MNNRDMVDAIGFLGKTRIENSAMDRDSKDRAKLRIEGLEILVKSLLPSGTTDQGDLRSFFEQVKMIKETAKSCSIKRVILIPRNDNGQINATFLMSEGNGYEFCYRLGLTCRSGCFSDQESAELLELVRQYGIILYE